MNVRVTPVPTEERVSMKSTAINVFAHLVLPEATALAVIVIFLNFVYLLRTRLFDLMTA